MWKSIPGFVAALLASSACVAADLTPLETRWLKGAWPVVEFARQARLALDIVVQPQQSPGAAPLALGFVQGRCKLVLSMRGNPEAQATLERIEPDLLDATLELMAAHELGHCRRYLDGAWHDLPVAFRDDDAVDASDAASGTDLAAMKAARREEGYADLVGLAWARQRHPHLYERLHAWLVEERSRDLVRGSPHDTLAWVRLAEDGAALVGASIFARPAELWAAALRVDD